MTREETHYEVYLRERAEKAEAKEQRVRALLDGERQSQCSCGRCPILIDARDILHALDYDQ